ncbi:thyroid adenoma-associated protein homolog [Selaginella moellendorffii]|uniref:thyroid adenoma-associated protein homolog n=1 Tax=Selaginella moellendorffii TaxID=88036 RepID=UPI000D1D038B|nr:thyroid adenoma-associated protein homolog [Selaginella moellendorffii]|eukprot:XP_024527150.1 thyroid adenoma-associated protein homolog [Selaginella moellendorffii]
MAAKWKAQQRKQRWQHSAVLLPSSLISRAGADARISSFCTALREWSSLGNTFDQVSGAKRLVAALEAVAGVESEALAVALSVFVEILFQEGSRPVHRTMLSALTQFQQCREVLEGIFQRCCADYGLGGSNERRFALVAVGLSLASLPKPGLLKDVVRKCSTLIASSASFDVRDVLTRSESGENATPSLMEDCQDAMSTVYYMLQNSSQDFGSQAFGDVVVTSLDVLQSSLMSRDCVVAAGVCLCATAQMSSSRSRLALMLAEALFPEVNSQCCAVEEEFSRDNSEQGKLESVIHRLRRSTMAEEAEKFTDFGRLCVLRGLLTAAPREVLNYCLLKKVTVEEDGRRTSNLVVWTLLYDGILPALCAATESSFDSHFKFHVMTALQICLQQIKASILGNVTAAAIDELRSVKGAAFTAPATPFSPTMTSRVMQIIWNNWEDPLNQTVRQVQMVFDLLADLQSSSTSEGGETAQAQNGTQSFLHQIANDLLTVGGHRKGRYVPLATLALRLGAQTLLEMCPGLLFQTIHAMSDDGVCCAASSFLKLFLERLRDECWNNEGVTQGSIRFRQLWVPPMVAGVVAGNPRLRINLHTYALSVGLEIDSDSLLQMLGFVLDGLAVREVPSWEDLRGAAGMPDFLTQNQRVALFVSLIKVARGLALMENEIRTSGSASEMTFLVKGVAVYAPISLLELALTHLEEGLRVDSAELICLNPKTAVMPSPFELHLLRVAMPLNMRCSSTAFRMKWTSLLKKFFSRVRVATDRQMKLESSKGGYRNGEQASGAIQRKLDSSVVTLAEMQAFMQWLTRLLVSSLYPSAPYERKYMAMEILNVLLDVWPTTDQLQSKKNFSPYGKELFSADYTMVLLGAVVDSWDRLRESAYKILLRYPTPLPGLEAQEKVAEVLQWGKVLANSPRVRESDAGALVLRLIFRKYVCELGWRVSLHPEAEAVQTKPVSGDQIVRYIESLNDWLEAGVLEGERNLVTACKHSFVHGVLLTLRYTFSELDWISDGVRTNVAGLRTACERLFKLLLKVTSLALWVVSVDALNLKEKEYEGLDEDVEDLHVSDSDDIEGDDDGIGGDDDASLLAPLEQMVMVGCWLSMKEVSLLLGTVARGAPLPGCSYNARTGNGVLQSLEESKFIMLESAQLEEIGQHFLQVLLAMKHNGAIDKTRVGFVALCNRLLLSSDTRLSKMPEIWMQQLMKRTVLKDQSLDDLLRRSAGIPASFLALFLSEHDGAPRKLLPMGLRWLIDNIKQFLNSSTSKDVVPVVHAFNTLRVTFNDTNLSTDTSGFCAEALIVAIKAFASPYWQVRNSATLAFTALLHRIVGFLNVHKQATARRAITGFEFFNRYPALHPFLLEELECATMNLQQGVTQSRLHPSLAPILVILSRLRPSIVNTRTDDWLSPSAFMPSVVRCATQCNLKLRVLASRALAPLVTAENLLNVLLELCSQLSKKPVRYNTIHGVLLQLSSLLKSNCTEVSQQEQQGQIVVQVFNRIKECTLLGTINRTSCFIVVAAFLGVLQDLLELAYQCQQVPSVRESMQQLQPVLLHLSSESVSHSDSSAKPWDSTLVDLKGLAADIYFSTILRGWQTSNADIASGQTTVSKTFYTTLREALADKMYEVRLATLKALKSFSTQDFAVAFTQLDARILHGLLTERLYTELHPRCVKRLLQVFLRWNLLAVDNDPQQDPFKIWNTLLGIYNTSKVSKTRESAVRCLGNCMQHLLVSMKADMVDRDLDDSDWEVFRGVLETWNDLIRRHSAASEPVNLRRAISSAIISSRCLEESKWLRENTRMVAVSPRLKWYRKIVLSVWSVTINLLEDEDIVLRQQLALALQDVMVPVFKAPHASVPAQVERVLETSLAFLRFQFQECDFFYDFLAGWILGDNSSRFGGLQNTDLVRKLFDKELDNHHEEQLLVVQLCCSHIESFLDSPEHSTEFVTKWRGKFLDQAVACAKWCLELQRSTHWVGGITNHQDVFKHLYRTLLGLLVLSTPKTTGNSSLSSLQALKGSLLELTSLSEVPLSPMISNLLSRLLQAVEHSTGMNLVADSFRASMHDSYCPDFEPFFLLK